MNTAYLAARITAESVELLTEMPDGSREIMSFPVDERWDFYVNLIPGTVSANGVDDFVLAQVKSGEVNVEGFNTFSPA